MHKETFEITQVLGKFISNPQNYVEIDDLIALHIQILNRKGYVTIGCCSGHQFDRIVDPDSTYEKEMRALNPQHTTEEPIVTGRIRPAGTNIIFAEGITPPLSPPLGFVIEKRNDNWSIRTEEPVPALDTTGTFEALYEIFEAVERLYAWTLNLPDFKNKDE
jgi:hypothetical protein